MKAVLSALAMLTAAVVGSAHAETAVLRGLDKVTGHARDFNAPVGRPVQFGTLEIVARRCSKAPPEETPEVTVFVEVFDTPPVRGETEAQKQEIFSGWMFASSPGLSALQHPVYDIWAIDCRA
ncbi:MAG: DUF2155 domain-containing protein [Alphaproteobacteria bacterium]|nr:DUF2155 domain-containing protein [Alphaproteobacteria bacterium]